MRRTLSASLLGLFLASATAARAELTIQLVEGLSFGTVLATGAMGRLAVNPDGTYHLVDARLIGGMPRPARITITGGTPHATVTLHVEAAQPLRHGGSQLRLLPLPGQSPLVLRLDATGSYDGGRPLAIGGLLEIPKSAAPQPHNGYFTLFIDHAAP